MRVLVTGAGGNIGSRLVKMLANHGNTEVRALVRPKSDTSRLSGLEETIFYGDLTKREDAQQMLGGIDHIYHLAAATSGSHFEMMMNTVVATENLLNAIQGHNIKRFVLISTFSAYQMTSLKPGSVLDETCPIETNLKARDSYTIVKVRQEKLVQKKCHENGIPLVIMRPGKIYGPDNYPIPPQLGLNIPGICFLYIGGNSIIPLTHVCNCAEAIFLAGFVHGVEGEIFNIVDDDLPTQKEYLRWYESQLGKLSRKVRLPYKLFKLLAIGFEVASTKTKGNVPPVVTRYRAENLWKQLHYDNTKAKEKLKWRPRISIRDGVNDMLQGLSTSH